MLVGKTTVTFNDDSTYEAYKGTTIYELSKIYQPKMKYRIVGAEIDNETVSMYTQISKATKINFIDLTTTNGYKINRCGLQFVLEVALKEALGKDYEVTYNHSIANGIHMTILSEKKFTLADAKKLKTMMNEIINNDEPITTINVETKEAIAYFRLFFFYKFGRGGVEQNDVEANGWLVKAAMNNVPPAQFLLGLAYDNGDGVPQDHEKALYWIRKAAANGLQEAKEKLKEMEK